MTTKLASPVGDGDGSDDGSGVGGVGGDGGGGDVGGCVATFRCGVSPLTVRDPYYELWRALRKPPPLVAAARRVIDELFGRSTTSNSVPVEASISLDGGVLRSDGDGVGGGGGGSTATTPTTGSRRYVALHWRFEEHACPRAGLEMGLCVWTQRGPVPFDVSALADAVARASIEAVTSGYGGSTSGGYGDDIVRDVYLATDGRRRGGAAGAAKIDALRAALATYFDDRVVDDDDYDDFGVGLTGGLRVVELHDLCAQEGEDVAHCAGYASYVQEAAASASTASAAAPKSSSSYYSAVLPEQTFLSELEQQVVADAAYALGSSRSSWYFEALLDRSARERDERAFDVAFEAEAALHAMCPKCHRGVPFPTLGGGSMDGLPYMFLGEDTPCAAAVAVGSAAGNSNNNNDNDSECTAFW